MISASRSSGDTVVITGSRPMNSGIRPNFSRSSGMTSAYPPSSFGFSGSREVLKPSVFLPTRCSTMWSRPANAPPTMNSTLVVSIWMNSWCGCLRPPCGGTRGRRALQDLQQRLLDALAGDVAGDRRVLALAGDLVDLVDVDDAGLGLLDVVVGRLDQLEQDVLDVLTDVAGLGQRGGVGDRERDVQHPGQRLGEVGLAAAGRADQQDVRLGQLDGLVLGVPAGARAALAVADPLVVVVDRHRERLLGLVLADDVRVEELVDLPRLGQLVETDLGALVRAPPR